MTQSSPDVWTQQNTYISLALPSPLGTSVLLLWSFEGEERLSAPFRFVLTLKSQSSAVDSTQVLGKSATIQMTSLLDGTMRYFNGIVTRFVQEGTDVDFTTYTIELRPWLWLLSLSKDCRIFQNLAVPDILQTIFSGFGFSSFRLALQSRYQPREFCVQYRETGLDFVSRLMEEEGIFYFFDHTATTHTMVIADNVAVHQPCLGVSTATMRGAAPPMMLNNDAVTEFCSDEEVITNGVALNDYNFLVPSSLLATAPGVQPAALGTPPLANAGTPSTSTGASSTGGSSMGGSSMGGSSMGGSSVGAPQLMVYDYPGGYTTLAEGNMKATVQIEAAEHFSKTFRGKSHHASFAAGHTFTLTMHPRPDFNALYVLRAVRHVASVRHYENHFEAFSEAQPFRPPRVTPKPVISGAQTATVCGQGGAQGGSLGSSGSSGTGSSAGAFGSSGAGSSAGASGSGGAGAGGGASGAQFLTDTYGRVKVQFRWDLRGQSNEQSSCWLRVVQGSPVFLLPDVGQEVVVAFLDGDPDRPMVIGVVFNTTKSPAYPLPSAQMKTTWRGNSAMGIASVPSTLPIMPFGGGSGSSSQPGQSGQSGQSSPFGQIGQSGQSGQSSPFGQSGQSSPFGQIGQSGQSGQSSQSSSGDPFAGSGALSPTGQNNPFGPQGALSPMGQNNPFGPSGALSPMGQNNPFGPQGALSPFGPNNPFGPQGELSPMGPLNPFAGSGPLSPTSLAADVGITIPDPATLISSLIGGGSVPAFPAMPPMSPYNEITIDDTQGSEQIFIHAKKDLNIFVTGNLGIMVEGSMTLGAQGGITIFSGGALSQMGTEAVAIVGESVAIIPPPDFPTG
jgi:type VI secretion system secreted protein VgrG